MPHDHRRVILKPPEADPGAVAQLATALGEAASIQNHLAAKCAYVLRFTSPWQQNETAFWIEHEPAEPLITDSPYAGGRTDLPLEKLVPVAAAVFSALAAGADAAGGGRYTIHGGICPGVLLAGEDGLSKVSDFGIAPAICRTLGVDAYLNLALGPRPGSTGTWEVLGEDEAERDDRLCGFVDPEKYGQDLLTSFEPGSDVIAAAMTLYLLLERRHPYLCFDPLAHRFVDTARMMSFGVPVPFTRKDLLEATDPALRTCRELLTATLERLPSRRPSAVDAAQKLQVAAPAPDLDRASAQRWLAHVEGLRAADAWLELERALREPPAIKEWPPEVRSRADELAREVEQQRAVQDAQAAIQAEHEAAARWFTQLQRAADSGEWQAAHELLQERPRLAHWPEHVLAPLESLTNLIDQKLAEEAARVWARALRKALQLHDWGAVGRRLAQRPRLESCPPDVRELISEAEAGHRRHLEEQERARQRVAQQHELARIWLADAKTAAGARHWSTALDILKRPPQLEHWPAEVRDQARQLERHCQEEHGKLIAAHLTDIENRLNEVGARAIREVITAEFAGLLNPECVETSVEVVWGSPVAEAHGRAMLLARLKPPQGRSPAVPAAVEPLRAELDFKLEDIQPQVVGGLAELRRLVLEGLPRHLHWLQTEQLRVLERSLRESVFPHACMQAELSTAQPRASATLRLLGPTVSEGELTIELRWSARDRAWALENAAELVERAAAVAHSVTQRAILETLLARSEQLRACRNMLAVVPLPGDQDTGTRLPTMLAYAVQFVGDGRENLQTRILESGTATSSEVGQARFEASLEELEAEFAASLAPVQNRSREELLRGIQDWAKRVTPPVQVIVPKSGGASAAQFLVELRPKSGDRVSLVATWNCQSLTYDLPPTWQQSVRPPATAPS